MIASNYRKHPAALALQLPLPFPRRLVWALPRPGARILRAIRVARGRAFEAAGRIRYPQKPAIPQWWKDAKRRARQLADQVRDACMNLVAEVRVAVTTADTELIGFNYEAEIAKAEAHGNRYRVNTLKRQAARLAPVEAPWNQESYDALLAKRKAVLDSARCPSCNMIRCGWSANWKRGVWRFTCAGCGTEWEERIPH